MTFYGNRHLVENSKLPQGRKDEALKVYDLISEHTKTKVMTHVTLSALDRLAKASLPLETAWAALEDLSDLKLLKAHATFLANGDEDVQTVHVPYKTMKKALAKGYFIHPDGRGRISAKLDEGWYFYFSLEERPKEVKAPQKKAVCASTTRHFNLELSMGEFVALCQKAGHDVAEDACISFTEAGTVHRLTVGDSISVRWAQSEKGGA
jgi:hypothetical protein